MITLLSLLHLIHTVYSSQCTNTHSQETLISISIQGNSVNKIGVTEYLDIIKDATDAFLPQDSITAGLLTFGGPPSAPYFQVDFALQSTTSANMQTLIDGLSSKDFDINYGNAVSYAVNEAITSMTTANAQRYHVIFAAGNPQGAGFGTGTEADKVEFISGAAAKTASMSIVHLPLLRICAYYSLRHSNLCRVDWY